MYNAIVTGGAAGIGRGVAIRLAKEGYRVLLLDKDQNVGQETKKEINSKLGTANFIECDVTDLMRLSMIIHNISKGFGYISVFVNTAGGVGILVSQTLKRTHGVVPLI